MALKQYILLRSDLRKFSKGALIAQACHGATYATVRYITHPNTVSYLEDTAKMCKVVLRIKEEDIPEISEVFRKNGVDFATWIEQPENIATCLCTRPLCLEEYPAVLSYLRKYKLF